MPAAVRCANEGGRCQHLHPIALALLQGVQAIPLMRKGGGDVGGINICIPLQKRGVGMPRVYPPVSCPELLQFHVRFLCL